MVDIGWPVTKPYIPGLEERIDFIVQALIDPCDAPISVWIEKMWPAFINLVLEWYALDLKNILIAYLRPGIWAIEGRSSRHWGRGKKGGTKGPWKKIGSAVSFDPNEWIGKHLGGADELRARYIPGGVGFLWLVEGIIERFLFYYMVVDLSTEFLYRWISAVMETRYCARRNDVVFLGKLGPIELSGLFDWDVQGSWTPLKMRNLTFFNGFGVSGNSPGGSCGATASVRPHPFLPSSGNVQSRIRVLSGPQAGRVMETTVERDGMNNIEIGASMPILAGDLCIFEIKVNGWWMLDEAHFFYQQVYAVPQ